MNAALKAVSARYIGGIVADAGWGFYMLVLLFLYLIK